MQRFYCRHVKEQLLGGIEDEFQPIACRGLALYRARAILGTSRFVEVLSCACQQGCNHWQLEKMYSKRPQHRGTEPAEAAEPQVQMPAAGKISFGTLQVLGLRSSANGSYSMLKLYLGRSMATRMSGFNGHVPWLSVPDSISLLMCLHSWVCCIVVCLEPYANSNLGAISHHQECRPRRNAARHRIALDP